MNAGTFGRISRFWPLLGLAALAPVPALCALGGTASTVAADSSALHASLRSEALPAFTRHSMTLPTGTQVNEYAGADGVVFAVTWNGPVEPDLQPLLGAYFDEYQAALPSAAVVPHRARMIKGPNVVVRTAGIMRAHWGRAYVGSAVPVGVSVGELP